MDQQLLDCTILVRGFHPATSKCQLGSLFERFGCVTRVKMMPIACAALVSFLFQESAEAAFLEAALQDGIVMGKRKLRLSWAVDSMDFCFGEFHCTACYVDSKLFNDLIRGECGTTTVPNAAAIARNNGAELVGGDGPAASVIDVDLECREVFSYDWL